jgi:S1-C subfamily serine protease
VRPALELAASVMPGDSGSPVVDGRGRVVGVVFAQASDREGLAYALDAGALRSILR